ncbi:MATE family efflux transporter [Aliivibrio fischeri]|uniref:MATE family efflux transporter n=1 Tax=Aliivibrio fischeri TaxID=668 RepID=UPI001EFF124D|nr:MATE family efflux transporter [Aliivibrio fischeri]MCE7534927.1 hypothetical protein [Aliivibrio fischeri]MCE7559369.1 hypothetical protein [Aliivibrio fischeri]
MIFKNKKITYISTSVFVLIICQSIFSLVDSYFISFIDDKALSAVNTVSSLNIVFYALGNVIGIGCLSIMSRCFEDDDKDKYFGTGLFLSLILSISIFILLKSLSGNIFDVIISNNSEELRKIVNDYFEGSLYHYVMIIPTTTIIYSLRSRFKTKFVMFNQILWLLINIILTYFFVIDDYFNIKLGIFGAGLSTSISSLGMFLSIWIYVKYYVGFTLRIKLDVIPKIINIGFPSALESIIVYIYTIVLIHSATSIGVNSVSALSIGLILIQAAFMPITSLSLAIVPFLGHELRKENILRFKMIYRKVNVYTLLFSMFTSLILYINLNYIVSIYTKSDVIVYETRIVTNYLIVNLVFSSVIHVNNALFQSCGETRKSLYSIMTRFITFIIPSFLYKEITLNNLMALSTFAFFIQMLVSQIFVNKLIRRF